MSRRSVIWKHGIHPVIVDVLDVKCTMDHVQLSQCLPEVDERDSAFSRDRFFVDLRLDVSDRLYKNAAYKVR